jgi:hypothetical protein
MDFNDHGFGILFDISKILFKRPVAWEKLYSLNKRTLIFILRKIFPGKLKHLIKNKILSNSYPVHSAPLYFTSIWTTFLNIISLNDIVGCELYGGETLATLSGCESEFCLAIIGDEKKIINALINLKDCDHFYLASKKRRIIDLDYLSEQPLMKLGTVDDSGAFIPEENLHQLFLKNEIPDSRKSINTNAKINSLSPKMKPPRFKLKRRLDLHDYGGAELFIGENNGEQILLWSQNLGIFHSAIYHTIFGKDYQFLTGEPRQHFCLTATDLAGNLLWQLGKPYNGNVPYIAHSGDHILASADIDKDGTTELIISPGQSKLLVLDATTGRIKRTALLPNDAFATVKIAKTGQNLNEYTILAQVAEQAWPPHHYCNPIMFFDSRLNPLAQMNLKGSGHAPLIGDFDGDGLDEFVIGYNMIDHDLKFLWTLDYWFGRKINPYLQHVDCIAKLGEKKEVHFYFAGSDMFYCADTFGRTIFMKQFKHPQHVLTGRFGADGTWRVFLLNCSDGPAVMMAPDGKILWEKLLPENWPDGKPEWLDSRQFHMGCPASVFRADGIDWILYNEGGWPYIIDGEGHLHYPFEWPKEAKQVKIGNIETRPDDYGYGFHAQILNTSHNNGCEVIIYNRQHAWIFHVE